MNMKRLVMTGLFCIAATAANFALCTLVKYVFDLPLYWDTVFTCALAFAAGFVPAFITAVLTWVAIGLRDSSFPHLFILCSVAEVVLVCLLKPKPEGGEARQNDGAARAAFYRTMAALVVLYITSALTVSVLGGLIDYTQYSLLSFSKPYFGAEDTFKLGLIWNNIPVLAADILARLPINIVDRALVIFGGYWIGSGVKRMTGNARSWIIWTKYPPTTY